MSNISTADREADGHRLLDRLNVAQGFIRKSGAAWCLFGPANQFARPLATIAPDIVASLLAKGKLVPRPQGGLHSLAQAMKHSGRLTDHRPPRPPTDDIAVSSPSVNEAESPLAWLRARKDKKGRPLIGAEQFLAGERLRGDYERGQLERRVTTSWELSASPGRGGGNSAADLSDNAIAARQNLQRALDAVGPELSGIMVQVCCLSAGIEQAERLLDMPQRSGKAVLALALTSLARHYGYLKTVHGNARRSTIGHWARDDFRPKIPDQDAS